MQTRLFACLAGGFLGITLTATVNTSLGLNPTFAVIACSGIGVAAGYVVSILVDVFTARPEDKEI